MQRRACANLGVCYYELGQTMKALALYEEAAIHDPCMAFEAGDEQDLGQLLVCVRDGVQKCRTRLAEEAAQLDLEK